MIEAILPAGVVSAEAFRDDVAGVLFPAEEATLSRAVDKRRREFTTARLCAHQALARLGLPPAPVLPGPRGEPVWPAGVVGSITHCAGYRAASVGRQNNLAAVGIDAEPNEQLPAGVLEEITVGDERGWLDELLTHGDRKPDTPIWWDRLLFSAKESVFKAWFPLTRKELDFDEAVVRFDRARRLFTARLLVPGPLVGGRRLAEIPGRWLVHNGLIVTAVALPGGSRNLG